VQGYWQSYWVDLRLLSLHRRYLDPLQETAYTELKLGETQVEHHDLVALFYRLKSASQDHAES
jgi:hypothetical protein